MKEFKVIVSSKINDEIDQILTDNNNKSSQKIHNEKSILHSKKYFEQSQMGTTKQWEKQQCFSQIIF